MQSSSYPQITNCTCCGSARLHPFYSLPNIPVHSCIMTDTFEEAQGIARRPFELSVCKDCGFILNSRFDNAVQDYTPAYEEQQSFSETFNAFAEKLAQDTINRYNLRGKTTIEIGCGKGDFLKLLCKLGDMKCIGIDPSVHPNRIEDEYKNCLTLIPEYYGSQHFNIPSDFICCRHTLEHIHAPEQFVSTMAQSVNHNPTTPLLIEVPDVGRVLTERAFWDVYYEHCSYFTPGSLARLIRNLNLTLLDLRLEYQNQYLIVEAAKQADSDTSPENKTFDIEDSPEDIFRIATAFGQDVSRMLRDWKDRVSEMHSNGKRVAVWGSGSKCVAFLTSTNLADLVDTVVDINPYRHGKFIPGYGKPISSPESLRNAPPAMVIAMNPIYLEEIRDSLSALGCSPELLAV